MNSRPTYRVFVLFTLFTMTCMAGQSQPLAFPSAEGAGQYVTGGRGGKVILVTNLNDDGPGSLREAIRLKEPRTVVFTVSGNIKLKSELEIKSGDLTIAGQSAPGAGICIRDYPVSIKSSNVIIRYIRVRLGDEYGVQGDCISATRQKDIILDHCSFSWGTDETATFYDNINFTMQWCLITESLNQSVHAKGEHGYGGIWGGKRASFHHNLLAHHKSRNPRFCGARYHKQPDMEQVDFWNNVVYNWQDDAAYGGEDGNHQMVNNYFKPGPATSKSKRDRFVKPYEPYGKYYVRGNVVEGNDEINADNRYGVIGDIPNSRVMASPLHKIESEVSSATAAFEEVLVAAGASFVRDEVDQRIAKEARNGQATYGVRANGIIDSPSDVGGWPALHSSKVYKDSDQDGMPDEWEERNGLDKLNPTDQVKTDFHPYYTNIELYLNQITETKKSNE